MKKLIICDTYYQMIVAIQLARTVFKNDEVDMWITDHSVGAEKVSERLSTLEWIGEVRYIKTKEIIYATSKIQKIKNMSLLILKI